MVESRCCRRRRCTLEAGDTVPELGVVPLELYLGQVPNLGLTYLEQTTPGVDPPATTARLLVGTVAY